MLDQGLQGEIEGLLRNGVDANATSMKMIGYRQMVEFLQGDITLEEMRHKGIVATRQLAKRQLTWLRNQPNLIWWVDTGLKSKNFQLLSGLLKQYIN